MHARTYQIPDISRIVLYEPSSFHVFEVISTPPSRVVGNDICSSQEFQTALSSSFADRSSRKRDEENVKEREEQEIESRFISNDDIEKKKKKKMTRLRTDSNRTPSFSPSTA